MACVFKVTNCDLKIANGWQVRRNADRFPGNFLFSLTNQEVASLRSHFAILKTGRGRHRKYPRKGKRFGAHVLHGARSTIAT